MRNIGNTSATAAILLVGLSEKQMGQVREVLAAETALPYQSIPYTDALEEAQQSRQDIIIVSYSEEVDSALALAQTMQKEMPHIQLIALAESSDAEGILAAMRVGYKEFVVLPEHGARLRQVIHDAAYTPDDNEEKGEVIAVIGAKGGVGTSLICANLAAELAAIHRVLCIDMDLAMGDISSILDLNPKDTISDLLSLSDPIEERILSRHISVHKSKTHVLPTPENPEILPDVKVDDIYSIINTAATVYQFVLIDCGNVLDEGVSVALSLADITLLVTTPDVLAARNAFRRMRQLITLGTDRERIRLVINRFNKNAYVTVDDIKENLDIPEVMTVREDIRTVNQAINEGKLLREINHKSEATQDIASLVASLDTDRDGPHDSLAQSAGKSGLLSRVFGR